MAQKAAMAYSDEEVQRMTLDQLRYALRRPAPGAFTDKQLASIDAAAAARGARGQSRGVGRGFQSQEALLLVAQVKGDLGGSPEAGRCRVL